MNKKNIHHLQKKSGKIGTFSTVMMSLVSLIGFGWLFGVFHTFQMVGPASIISWIIGGGAIFLIALTLIELGTMFPKVGGIVHFLNISHGPIAGFVGAFVNWFVMSSIVILEASASVQCLATWNYSFTKCLFDTNTGMLTWQGFVIASILIFIYFILNYWSLRVFVALINIIGVLKLIIPIVIAFVLIIAGLGLHNPAPVRADFMPYGWTSVLKAVPLCGIFFCYYGFHSILSFSEEMEDPDESIPMAIIGSIIFCIILYVLLQIAFITVVPPGLVVQKWNGLDFLNSPYAKLAIALNLNFTILLLNIETIVSPNGSGFISSASGFRMIEGMQEYSQMPGLIKNKIPIHQINRKAIIVNFIVCFILLALTRSWSRLVEVVTVACIISYIPGPIAAGALRKAAPNIKRSFRFPFMSFICPLAFIVCSLALYWAKWNLLLYVFIFILISLCFFIITNRNNFTRLLDHFRSSYWLLTYMIVMIVISYYGSKDFGGIGYLPGGYDQLIVAVVALFFYFWAIKSTSYRIKREFNKNIVS